MAKTATSPSSSPRNTAPETEGAVPLVSPWSKSATAAASLAAPGTAPPASDSLLLQEVVRITNMTSASLTLANFANDDSITLMPQGSALAYGEFVLANPKLRGRKFTWRRVPTANTNSSGS